MAHQYMPKMFHGPHKNPPGPPRTYLMYGPLDVFLHLIPSPRRVTRGGDRGEVSPALFEDLKESALILGKNALTRFIYGFNFMFNRLF